MVGKRIVCSHRPAIRRNVVYLDMKIGADPATCDAIDLAVKVGASVEVRGNGIRWQVSVVRVVGRVVAPKGSGRAKVLVHATKQIDIGAVGCRAEPATRCGQ